MDLNKLKALLAIDKTSLDEEISKQPTLFYEVAEALVTAMAERDACKEELATIDAELDGQVRAALGRSEEKVTEAMVRNSVQVHKKHEAATDTYMAAKTNADLLGAMKEAFAQRSYMLRDLCSLYVSSYYEQSSVQGTNSTDKAQYDARRKQLASARRERVK